MATFKINIDMRKTEGRLLFSYLKSLAQKTNIIKIIEEENTNKDFGKIGSNTLVKKINKSLKEVKQIKEGKLPKKTLNQLIEELKD